MKKYLFVNIKFPIEITSYGMQSHSDRFIVELCDCNELPPINSSSSMDEEIQKIISKANEYAQKKEPENEESPPLPHDSDNSDSETSSAASNTTASSISDPNIKETEEPAQEGATHPFILKKDIHSPKHVLKNQTFKKNKKKNNVTHKIL